MHHCIKLVDSQQIPDGHPHVADPVLETKYSKSLACLNVSDGPSEMGDNLAVIDLGSGFVVISASCGLDHCCASSENS